VKNVKRLSKDKYQTKDNIHYVWRKFARNDDGLQKILLQIQLKTEDFMVMKRFTSHCWRDQWLWF
jgi:hypothetical protein